jgi:hypothetical protein
LCIEDDLRGMLQQTCSGCTWPLSHGENNWSRYKEQPTVVRTTREENLNVHKALFQPGGLPDGTELGYYVKGQVQMYSLFPMNLVITNRHSAVFNNLISQCTEGLIAWQCVRKGVKRSGGICCSCCNTVVKLSDGRSFMTLTCFASTLLFNL